MKLLAIRDKNGITIPVVPMSDYIGNVTLSADAHATVSVPSGMSYALVTPPVDLYVKRIDTSFALPSSNITDGTGPLYIPAGASRLILVHGVDTLGMRCLDGGQIAVEWFE